MSKETTFVAACTDDGIRVEGYVNCTAHIGDTLVVCPRYDNPNVKFDFRLEAVTTITISKKSLAKTG